MVSTIARLKTETLMSHDNIKMSNDQNKLNPDISNLNKFAKIAQMVVKKEYRIKYLKNVTRMYEGR